MAQVEFSCNGTKIIIQSNLDEKMKDIIQRYITKTEFKYENVFFLYNGESLNEDLSFNEIANELDKNRKQMNILVNTKEEEPLDKSFLKKSKYIICPQCKELINIYIKDYKIYLYECKNGHRFDEISFIDFEKTQYIDESQIKCENEKCQKSIIETYQNKLYICLTCKKNLCPICQTTHDKSHYIIDYYQKDFICQSHCDNFTFCCKYCEKDLCSLCEKKHNQHKIISYGSILPEKEDLEKDLNNTEKTIIKFKENINQIISKLNNVVQNIDIYFNIFRHILSHFDIKNKNYILLQNVNDIKEYNNKFIKDINDIIKDKDINSKFNKIIKISDIIEFKNLKKDIKNNEIDKNNIEEIEYNPSDIKFENFSLNNLKEIKSFKIEYEVNQLMILNDGRLLCYFYEKENKVHKNKISKLCIYNINKNIICDII